MCPSRCLRPPLECSLGIEPQVAGHLFAALKTLRGSHRQRERECRDRPHARMGHQPLCRRLQGSLLGYRKVQLSPIGTSS